LRLELASVRPELLVLLGGTAAQATLGRSARVNRLRGSVLEVPEVEVPVVVTLHPSAVLRAGERRHERRAELVEDLSLVREHLAGRTRTTSARR
jgi:DNA polymerase